MKCQEFDGVSRFGWSVQIPTEYRDWDGTSMFRWNTEIAVKYSDSMKYTVINAYPINGRTGATPACLRCNSSGRIALATKLLPVDLQTL